MKRCKGIVSIIIGMALGLIVPIESMAAIGELIPTIVLSTGKGQPTVSYQAGERKELVIQVSNEGTMDANNVIITPRIEHQEGWPFEIQRQDNYATNIGVVKAQSSVAAKFDLTALQNVSTGRYKLEFDITYDDGTLTYNVTKYLYVNAVKKEEPDGKKPGEQEPGEQEPQGSNAPEGSVSNSGGAASGGETSTSVPRVIVSGFSTEPSDIKAGSDFKLVVHLQNTSQKTAVRNMLFDFSAPTAGADATVTAPAFLPISGSSSVYLDGIPAGGTKDIEIALNSRADLVQKPYEIAMSMKYEDKNGTQYDGTSTLAIPIKQPARFEFSELEMTSDTVEVGMETNVTCSLYNLGRVKLYNVKATFQLEGIKGQNIYVGNVDSGATATIDGMLTGEKETVGNGVGKMVVTYEDEVGTIFAIEKELTLQVVPVVEKPENMVNETAQKKLPILGIVVGILAISAVVTLIIVLKSKKKKKLLQEEENLADELDRLIEDE